MPYADLRTRYRMRLLSLIQMGYLAVDDVQPPLTDEERQWLGLAPRKLLAEVLAEPWRRAE